MNIFRKVFNVQNFRNQKTEKILYQFTSLDKTQSSKDKTKKNEEQEQVFNFGRSWQVHELKLKSNEDLHKLWYVLLKEKNSIFSDDLYMRRAYGDTLPVTRINRVSKSMKNIWKVLDQRKIIREKFQNHLLMQYTEEKQEQHNEEFEKYELENKFKPEINSQLIQKKIKSLQLNDHSTNYLQSYINHQNQKKKLKTYLKKKYDYKNKQILDKDELTDQQLKEIDPDNTIFKFTSSFLDQYHNGRRNISQEEILRMHIKNWKDLDLKMRRVIVNYINARRARDAKKMFMQELSLLSQKIAHENKQLENQSQKNIQQILFLKILIIQSKIIK